MATTSFVITTVKKVGGFIYDDVEDKEEAEKKIKCALDEGYKITFKGGREQWQMDEAITVFFTPEKVGVSALISSGTRQATRLNAEESSTLDRRMEC